MVIVPKDEVNEHALHHSGRVFTDAHSLQETAFEKLPFKFPDSRNDHSASTSAGVSSPPSSFR